MVVEIKGLVKLLHENKAKNVSVYDLSSEAEEKFVVLCTTNKPLDGKKLADVVASKYGYDEKIEGYFKGEWIIFDFPKLTLHVFLPKVREKYNLDKLYKPKKISI